MRFKRLYKGAHNQLLFFHEEEKELLQNYVSYNPTANRWKPETALRYNWKFYILNWDLRKECEKCKNIEEAKEVFLKSDFELSSWSDYQNKDF